MMFFLRKTPHRPELNEEREGARRLARRRSRLVLPGLVAGRETRCTGVSSPRPGLVGEFFLENGTVALSLLFGN